MARRTVAVVGGGCSGVLAARELLRCTGDDVVLVEPGEPGGGLAYGAAQPWHLLNSRAGAMSADPDDAGHFARWSGAEPHEFRSRQEYGRYLREIFADTAARHADRFEVRADEATAVRPDGMVTLAGGHTLRADNVVLATGNPAAAHPARAVGLGARAAAPGTTGSAASAGCSGSAASGRTPPPSGSSGSDHAAPGASTQDHPDYVADPWASGALDQIPADQPVLLIGAGLTAIDVALSLTADGRRTAPITAVSRRGQLPLSHTVVAAPPADFAVDDCATLRDVVRAVRAEADQAGDWRAVVDGLRPHLDELWVALTRHEQEAFLRHLARPWECHRHRMAPSVAARVADLREQGRLEVRAGGLHSIRPIAAGGLHVELEAGRQWFGAVVNCAGPGRLPGAAGPLVRRLLDSRRGPGGAARAGAGHRPGRAAGRGGRRGARPAVADRPVAPRRPMGDHGRTGDPRAGPAARDRPERRRARPRGGVEAGGTPDGRGVRRERRSPARRGRFAAYAGRSGRSPASKGSRSMADALHGVLRQIPTAFASVAILLAGWLVAKAVAVLLPAGLRRFGFARMAARGGLAAVLAARSTTRAPCSAASRTAGCCCSRPRSPSGCGVRTRCRPCCPMWSDGCPGRSWRS